MWSAAAAAAPAKISYEQTSWGHVTESWWIDDAGRAELSAIPQDGNLTSPLQTQSFAVTRADFERISRALAGAERWAGRELPCTVAMTDAPSASLTWMSASGASATARWYFGCRSSRRRERFLAKADAAHRIFHQLTNTRHN